MNDTKKKKSVAIVGVEGRMGQNNIALFQNKKDIEITALFDRDVTKNYLNGKNINSFKRFWDEHYTKDDPWSFIDKFRGLFKDDTIVVDFSSPQATVYFLELFFLMQVVPPKNKVNQTKTNYYRGVSPCNPFGELQKLIHNFFVPIEQDCNGIFKSVQDLSKLPNVYDNNHNSNYTYIIGTTGFTPEQEEFIEEISKYIRVIKSGNFSVGINVLTRLVEKTAQILGEEYDIEMIEHHHNQKVDAPSGTAKMLLAAAQQGRGWEKCEVTKTQRSGTNAKRKKEEIGMFAVRGGGVVGHHEALYLSQNDKVTLSHTAFNRDAFTSGVYQAVSYAAQANDFETYQKGEGRLLGMLEVLELDKL